MVATSAVVALVALIGIGTQRGHATRGTSIRAAATTVPTPVPTTTVPPTTAPATAIAPPTEPPTTRTTTTAAPTTQAVATIVPGPPYRLTSTTLPLVDTSRPTVSHGHQVSAARALTTLVWAPGAPGRWPLVVFAHGFQVGPEPYTSLLESWAAAGFVVAAPEFPLTDPAVAGANLDESDIDNQPADVRFVIDQLVAPASSVASRIDPGAVAVAGHSDGAETALAASLDPAPSGEPVVRAVIAMSVSPLPGVTRTANPPLLVTQGDADDINPPSEGYQTWQMAASPKYLAVLHGGGHLPPLEAGSAWLPEITRISLDFLRAYLGGGTAPAAIVSEGNANPTLVTVTSG
ncbi:MAG: hypothetical protein M3R71_04490 [Actinomycetota bacterium]|nr:hypothetical protein [Actinomycetota bacterium]